ncbi:hypothetical protein HL667_22290 [Bradyrhizobium sp. 83012]|uniref:Uncharacterized protein n=1 Tax=Bradyrhizobium aeschynomenes TaxID=2734909 RepID=A0ABX2CJ77_9BRAD|nr:hypothetical protein [Bradyrhizobium aeschynomenes]NPU14303.1 hypothetical protein [Bradyrhizobium aeschynomenes]NPU67750.1 hypothetical protein [Bradyrhizobium aeschynomenes]NPV23912.1 hypothetical protein [Bradyrhizobium aeschynomenes]
MSYMLDLVLAAALLFFLFLPITDRRTVMLKLGMMTAAVILFAAVLVAPHAVAPAAPSAQAQLVTRN